MNAMRRIGTRLAVAIALGWVLFGCTSGGGGGGGGIPPANRPPVIVTFTKTPDVVGPGAQASLAVNASDPDNDVLTYNWSATCGVFSNNTSVLNNGPASLQWRAPSNTGTSCLVTVTVLDGKGGQAQQTLAINIAGLVVTITNPANNATLGGAHSRVRHRGGL